MGSGRGTTVRLEVRTVWNMLREEMRERERTVPGKESENAGLWTGWR